MPCKFFNSCPHKSGWCNSDYTFRKCNYGLNRLCDEKIMKIDALQHENAELKRLLKLAVEGMTNEIICKIATHYGAEHQILKTIEECGELQTAIIKYCFAPSDTAKQTLEHLVEEAADVYILMLQIRALFSPEVFDQFVLAKLRRQELRMTQEKNMENLP